MTLGNPNFLCTALYARLPSVKTNVVLVQIWRGIVGKDNSCTPKYVPLVSLVKSAVFPTRPAGKV